MKVINCLSHTVRFSSPDFWMLIRAAEISPTELERESKRVLRQSFSILPEGRITVKLTAQGFIIELEEGWESTGE